MGFANHLFHASTVLVHSVAALAAVASKRTEDCRTMRSTEWCSRDAVRQFGSHGAAAIGELAHNSMKWFIIILAVLLEIAALVAVIRVWRHKQPHWMAKLFWSVVLLVPFLGLLFYGFLAMNPESQSDHTEVSHHE